MQIFAPDDFYRKSGPSIASSDTVTSLVIHSGMQSRSHLLSAEREVVQTNAYMDNVSILEAPIAPELSGRI